MMSQVYSILQQIITSCSGWFTQIMDATGAGDFYLAMVFICLTVGFLLSNFGNAFRSGSDLVAKNFRKRSDK